MELLLFLSAFLLLLWSNWSRGWHPVNLQLLMAFKTKLVAMEPVRLPLDPQRKWNTLLHSSSCYSMADLISEDNPALPLFLKIIIINLYITASILNWWKWMVVLMSYCCWMIKEEHKNKSMGLTSWRSVSHNLLQTSFFTFMEMLQENGPHLFFWADALQWQRIRWIWLNWSV